MLTRQQKNTLSYIESYIKENGYSPTTREIAIGLGIQSRGVVHRYLKKLQESGVISLTPNKHRNILLLNKEKNHELPLMGKIAAGEPIEAVQDGSLIDVIGHFLGDDRYALAVHGDSMIDDGILDGDIIVCRKSQTADPGEIVVALIDEQDVTLKHWQPQGEKVTLKPANQTHEPKTYNQSRVQIQGIYVGLLRFS